MSARLIEIELRVRDVTRSAHFYRDLVGVTVGDIERHDGDSEPHVLNIYPADGPITSSHIGFAVSDRPWGRSAAYRDPDGNTVTLTEARR